MSEFPKMLYRRGKIRGALKLWPHKDVFYAIANDEEEQDAMISEAGFSLTVEGAKNRDECGGNDDRESLVKEAEALGIKPGRKGVKKLAEEIAAAKTGSDDDSD